MTARPARRRTVDGAFWSLVGEGMALPSGLLTVAYLTRQFGPDGYGAYALAATLVTWLASTLHAFLGRASVAFVSRSGSNWRPTAATVLRLYVGLGSGLAVGLALSSGALARALGAPALATLLPLFALDLPLAAVAFGCEQVLVGRGRYRHRALVRAGYWGVRLALIVAFVAGGLSAVGAVLGNVAASGVYAAAAWHWTRPPVRGRGVPVGPLLRFAWPLLAAGLALRVLARVDLVALKALGGTDAEAGFYAAAQNLALAVGLLGVALAPLLLASLTRAVESGDGAMMRQQARQVLRLPFVLLPFVALGAGAAPGVVRVVYGAAFAPAAPLLALLLAAAVGSLTTALGASVLTAYGRPRWTAAVATPLLALALAGYAAVAPAWGAIGVAALTAGAFAAAAMATLAAVRHVTGAAPSAATVARSTGLAVAAYASAAALPMAGSALVAALVALAVGVAAGLLLLGEVTPDDRAAMRSLRLRSPLPA